MTVPGRFFAALYADVPFSLIFHSFLVKLFSPTSDKHVLQVYNALNLPEAVQAGSHEPTFHPSYALQK